MSTAEAIRMDARQELIVGLLNLLIVGVLGHAEYLEVALAPHSLGHGGELLA